MRREGKITIFGDDHEPECLDQMRRICEDDDVYGAVLCGDAHLGYSVPVGGVVAYRDRINVNGVGFDIACGNKAVRVSASAEEVRENIYRTMNEIQKHISFGIGRKNNEKVEHELFDDPVWDILPFLALLKDKAREQLGTVGSGNHYVDLFVDERNHVWIGVHFGSRGLGHTIASEFIKAGGGVDGINAKPVLFDVNSDLGQQYLMCMELAGRYAYAGRDWVCQRVAQILRADILEEVHNHHNFAWNERHTDSHGKDQDLWVVRKGSTPAFPGQKGFVGSSMGEVSVIIEGAERDKWPNDVFYSTVHGAGRVMGRTAAVGKIKNGRVVKEGRVKRDEHDAWMQRAGVEVRGGGLDESPYCYKRLPDVLKAHGNSVKVLHWLLPIGVCMADGRERDPYKD
jgi:tRNA-splicing ligase RtcB